MRLKLLLVSLLMTHLIFSQIPTNDLIAKYEFDNFSFADAINGDNFLKRGTAASNATGILGQSNSAVLLNGDELFRPDIVFENNDSPINQQKTISFWIKTSTNDTNERIMYNDTDKTSVSDTDFNGTYVYLKEGKIHATKGVTYVSEITHTHNTIVSDGNWHHIVIQTYSSDNSTDGNYRHIAYIYVDGVKEGGSVIVGSHINNSFTYGIHAGDINFSTIENGTVTSANKFQNVLDQLLIYDRLLTDTEINTLYGQRATASVVNEVFNKSFLSYPNPVKNRLTISLETGQELKKVSVFNLLGKKVIETTASSIDFSGFSKGIYLLRIENVKGEIAMRKIMKE